MGCLLSSSYLLKDSTKCSCTCTEFTSILCEIKERKNVVMLALSVRLFWVEKERGKDVAVCRAGHPINWAIFCDARLSK